MSIKKQIDQIFEEKREGVLRVRREKEEAEKKSQQEQRERDKALMQKIDSALKEASEKVPHLLRRKSKLYEFVIKAMANAPEEERRNYVKRGRPRKSDVLGSEVLIQALGVKKELYKILPITKITELSQGETVDDGKIFEIVLIVQKGEFGKQPNLSKAMVRCGYMSLNLGQLDFTEEYLPSEELLETLRKITTFEGFTEEIVEYHQHLL